MNTYIYIYIYIYVHIYISINIYIYEYIYIYIYIYIYVCVCVCVCIKGRRRVTALTEVHALALFHLILAHHRIFRVKIGLAESARRFA